MPDGLRLTAWLRLGQPRSVGMENFTVSLPLLYQKQKTPLVNQRGLVKLNQIIGGGGTGAAWCHRARTGPAGWVERSAETFLSVL
jgi:hypothetical protein